MSIDQFVTDEGVTVPAVTTDQMREVDRVAIDHAGPNLYQMMENAGRGLALMVIETLGDRWRSSPIVVLAGTGGNGGGGICAARHLANRGADVTLVVSEPGRLTPVPRDQLHIYRGTAGRSASLSDLDALEPALIVDAIIGYSLRAEPRGAALHLVEWATSSSAPIVALDVPSGTDATTGEAPGAHLIAETTVTLALPKTGLDATAAGDVWLADLGIPAAVYRELEIHVPSDVFGHRFRVPLKGTRHDR